MCVLHVTGRNIPWELTAREETLRDLEESSELAVNHAIVLGIAIQATYKMFSFVHVSPFLRLVNEYLVLHTLHQHLHP